jgi:hypothetical protein
MRSSLEQILGYRRLANEVEALRQTKYSTDNPAHEEMLVQVDFFIHTTIISIIYF